MKKYFLNEMNNFLFFNDIRNFLTEAERMIRAGENGNFEVNVTAYWGKPKPNPNFNPEDPNSSQTIVERIINVNFFNVSAEALDTLEKTKFPPSRVHQMNENGTYNFTYNYKKINDSAWKKLMEAVKILQQFQYQVPDIEQMSKNYPETGEIEERERFANEKWMEMIQELGNGKTNQMIERFVEIFGKVYEWLYGHKLTYRNAKLILSQKPDATLVFTPRDWERMYNRKVVNWDNHILYWAPVSNKTYIDNNYNIQKKQADAMGIEFNKNREHTTQSANALSIEAADTQNRFVPVYGFDVTDTEPIDSNEEDKLETTYGLSNNLTGEMNQMTTDFVNGSKPKEGEEEEYEKIREVIKDNARIYFEVLVSNLKKNPKTEAAAQKYEEMAKANNGNVDYGQLFTRVVKLMVDGWLEDDYKVKKPTLRIPAREKISGMVLYFCGVWDRTALTSIQGGSITKEMAVHYSNIINKMMTLLDNGKRELLTRLQKTISFSKNGQSQENTPQVNESVLNEKTYCTPEKLIDILDLTVIPDNKQDIPTDEFIQKRDENKTAVYEMLARMNKLYNKPFYV